MIRGRVPSEHSKAGRSANSMFSNVTSARCGQNMEFHGCSKPFTETLLHTVEPHICRPGIFGVAFWLYSTATVEYTEIAQEIPGSVI